MDNLFTLLCLGLGTQQADSVDLNTFRKLSLKEWAEVKEMADKQGVSAIVLDGLNLLVNEYGREYVAVGVDPASWQCFVLEWAGMMAQIEQRNALQWEVMEKMASKWNENGCKVMVFKGQAIASMYPNPNHRNPGDIDCYLFENYAKGNDVAREIGADVDESWYKHSVIKYRGESFENHQYFVCTREGKRGKFLEKELENGLSVIKEKLTASVFLPPVQWNAMFLTYHACSHFLSEGLRLKQVLDWAMFLNKYQENVDWKAFYAYSDSYHFRRFADAMTAIAVNYLGVQVYVKEITADSPYADKILDSALYDDDYVFGSGKGNWHNRFHLIRNLFHYRWKYEEIYQESVWKQLWYYVSGFLLHTE